MSDRTMRGLIGRASQAVPASAVIEAELRTPIATMGIVRFDVQESLDRIMLDKTSHRRSSHRFRAIPE